jgi:hypothetical protein
MKRSPPCLLSQFARAALTALAFATPPPALAQTKGFVLRPRPLPDAHSFLVAELGVMTQLVGKNVAPGDDELQFVSDHGVVFNASEKFGVGLVVHGEAGGSRSRLGPPFASGAGSEGAHQ